jgi:hypothetical protein
LALLARRRIFNRDVLSPSLDLRDPSETSPIDPAQFQAALDHFPHPTQKKMTTADLI